MAKKMLGIKYEHISPSCPRCWNGYIFSHDMVICNKCKTSSTPTLEQTLIRNEIKGETSYCDCCSEIRLDKNNNEFYCTNHPLVSPNHPNPGAPDDFKTRFYAMMKSVYEQDKKFIPVPPPKENLDSYHFGNLKIKKYISKFVNDNNETNDNIDNNINDNNGTNDNIKNDNDDFILKRSKPLGTKKSIGKRAPFIDEPPCTDKFLNTMKEFTGGEIIIAEPLKN